MKPIERKPLKTSGGMKPINRVAPGMAAPKFKTLLTAHPEGASSILDMPETGDPQENAEAEISEALRAIKEAKRERRDAFRTMTDPNFYLVVCFQSTDQRDEFVSAAGWSVNGCFVDGLALARRLGVPLEVVNLPAKTNRPAPAALRGHAMLGAADASMPDFEEEGG